MAYPTDGNLAQALADLAVIGRDVDTLQKRGREILAEIKPALLGQRVRKHGRLWQICQVQIWRGGYVTCYGVTVSKTGRVGTRGFDLGRLDRCEFITGESDG